MKKVDEMELGEAREELQRRVREALGNRVQLRNVQYRNLQWEAEVIGEVSEGMHAYLTEELDGSTRFELREEPGTIHDLAVTRTSVG